MAVSEQVQGGPSGLLSGLVEGYLGAHAQHVHADLQQRVEQRDMMLKYLGMLANNPDIAQEHRQWALGKIQEGIQHPIDKKPWEVKLSDMPAVMKQAQAPSVQPQVPQTQGIQLPQAPQQSSEVGRQGNGEVNAMGALPGASVQLPAQPAMTQGRVQGPTPPATQVAPGGAPHLMSIEEKQQQALDAQQHQMQALQQQFPHKTTEEVAQFMEKGVWPAPVKPQVHALSPGQQLVEEGSGKVLATNTEAKPGAKSGFEPMMGPGGPIGVKDVATGGMLSPEEVVANPHAKAVWEQATKEHKAQLSEQEAKEARHDASQAAQQARAFAQQINMLEARQETLSGTTKTMVEAAPRVKELVAKVREDMKAVSQGPFASRWQEFWAGKVGTGNPAYTKLRTDAGLLQTLLMRMHVGARGGEHMMEHFSNLIGAGKQSTENMEASLNSIDSYASDVQGEGETAKGKVSEKARGKTIQKPLAPSSSTSDIPAPHSHSFSIGSWKKANPQGDEAAARKAAQAQGFEVVP